jgi:hypothetical protein
MAYEQEDAIVVTPPTEIETESESETTPVAGNRGTSAAIVHNEPKPSREFTYTREDIKAFARDEVQKLVDEGKFDDIVEANPETTGSEPELESLKVGGVKYQIPSGTPVAANPTLAGTESALTGLKVGDTKYKVEQPTEVIANPTLAGTEAALEGLQVGNAKYKVGGGDGGYKHCYQVALQMASSGLTSIARFLYFTNNGDITDGATFKADLAERGFKSYDSDVNKVYPVNAVCVVSSKLVFLRYISGLATNSNYIGVQYIQYNPSNGSIDIFDGSSNSTTVTKIY